MTKFGAGEGPIEATPQLKAYCLDCGMDYDDFGMDVLLPRHQWLDIHPAENGLLCALCIVRRAHKLPRAVALHAVIGIAPEWTGDGRQHAPEAEVSTATTLRPEGSASATSRPHGNGASQAAAGDAPRTETQAEVAGGGSAPSRSLPAPTWQPIETAPKDKLTRMLLLKGRSVCIGSRGFYNGWSADGDADAFTFSGPTHWMPLSALVGLKEPASHEREASQMDAERTTPSAELGRAELDVLGAPQPVSTLGTTNSSTPQSPEVAATRAASPQPFCEGCIRGLGIFMRGDFTKRWHSIDGRDVLCTTEDTTDTVSRAMHVNGVRGVEACFSKEEWEAASNEMHDSGNSSWVGIVRIAVENIRIGRADKLSEKISALAQEMRDEVQRIGKDFDIYTVPSLTVWQWVEKLSRLLADAE